MSEVRAPRQGIDVVMTSERQATTGYSAVDAYPDATRFTVDMDNSLLIYIDKDLIAYYPPGTYHHVVGQILRKANRDKESQ